MDSTGLIVFVLIKLLSVLLKPLMKSMSIILWCIVFSFPYCCIHDALNCAEMNFIRNVCTHAHTKHLLCSGTCIVLTQDGKERITFSAAEPDRLWSLHNRPFLHRKHYGLPQWEKCVNNKIGKFL